MGLTSKVLAEPLPAGAVPVAALQESHILGPHMSRDGQSLHISPVQNRHLVEPQLLQQAVQNLLLRQGRPRASQGKHPECPAEPHKLHGAAQESCAVSVQEGLELGWVCRDVGPGQFYSWPRLGREGVRSHPQPPESLQPDEP